MTVQAIHRAGRGPSSGGRPKAVRSLILGDRDAGSRRARLCEGGQAASHAAQLHIAALDCRARLDPAPRPAAEGQLAQRARELCDLTMARAADQVVVDHAGGLHVSVDGGGAHKTKAALLEVAAQGLG